MNMPLDSMKGVIKQEVPPSGSQCGSFTRQIFMQSGVLKLLESWKGSYYKKCFWCYVKRNRDSECLRRTIREKVSEYKCKILILLVVGKMDQTEHMVKQLKQFRICLLHGWVIKQNNCKLKTLHIKRPSYTLVHRWNIFAQYYQASSSVDI